MVKRLLVVLLLAGSTTVAQAQATQPIGYKDPTTATLFSFLLTGGGQMYAGEVGKGALLLGTSVAAIVAGAALSTDASCDAYFDCEDANLTPLYVGAGVSLATWIYSLADASKAAARANAKLSRQAVMPTVSPGAGGSTRLGLAVSF